jgi:hypothetical protein
MAEAQKIVDGLAVKEYPVVMERNGELFITRHNLNAKEGSAGSSDEERERDRRIFEQ